ncbi:flagellar motor protein MotA [Spiribacter sp. 2438]|nr:MotA/TolQ/ExbB proton channel family protein [Spiribacter sp. 2438]QGM22465.1 flagellar motor protein MotA [Spiribacter sp. 2438]
MAFLAAVALVAGLLHQPLSEAFLANPVFNGMILGVLFIGLVINCRQIVVLRPEVEWVEQFRRSEPSDMPPLPGSRLLGSMAKMLTGRRGDHLSLSAMSLRTVLDGIRSRLDESRDVSRYMIGLLVFLGLLGTFWGLLDTLRAVGGVIGNLTVSGADAGQIFAELRDGLRAPLEGMGTAFSSSLFGLAGALVLGFVDLQASHAQNRFYNDLEEWLSGQTRLSSGALGGDGEGSVPAYIQALLENTADSLDKLQRTMARGEEERRGVDARIIELTEEVSRLAEQSQSEQRGVMSLTRTQSELQGVLGRLADATETTGAREGEHIEQLRAMAHGLQDLRQELATDRERLIAELRDEVRLLTRTVSHLRSDGD